MTAAVIFAVEQQGGRFHGRDAAERRTRPQFGGLPRHHIYQAAALLDYNAYPHLILIPEGFPQRVYIVHGQLRHIQGVDSLFRGLLYLTFA